MAQLKFKSNIFTVSAGSTVLDTLLEQGHEIPNNCRAGACLSCVMQVTEGKVPEKSQKGLKDSQKAKGYFLACSCEPDENIDIQLVDTNQLRVDASVKEINKLSIDVIELKVSTNKPFKYNAGQYVTLWKDNVLGRSYSLANLPEDNGDLCFHIRKIPNGKFSNWVHNELKIGDCISVQGPAGDCFYTSGNLEQNILLIGTGTGLAPLIGIINDALRHGHTGEIHLFHGALRPSGLYLTETLTKLAQKNNNLKYHPCVMTAEKGMISNITEGDISKIALECVPSPKNWKSFLCGNEDLVNKLKKQIFIAGSNMNDIYTDPFVKSK